MSAHLKRRSALPTSPFEVAYPSPRVRRFFVENPPIEEFAAAEEVPIDAPTESFPAEEYPVAEEPADEPPPTEEVLAEYPLM
jgi:hypothetical protein